MVQTYHHSPHEVVEHGIVLVLPHTVVRMQVNMCFSQAMLLKKVVEQRDDGPFPVSLASSMRLICRGMASQHTPKIPHLRGVRKYMGPGSEALWVSVLTWPPKLCPGLDIIVSFS